MAASGTDIKVAQMQPCPRRVLNSGNASSMAMLPGMQKIISEIEGLGWRAVVIWECETENLECLEGILREAFKLPVRKLVG